MSDAIKTMRLGKTGLEVSRTGIGGIPIVRPSDADAIAVVKRALDLGITFIDTANGYGTSEERIGKALASSGRREQVVLATKTHARDRATALEHLELSLSRLQTDTIDLWQLHNVSSMEDYERRVHAPCGALEAAREALQAGVVRHIGLSSHSLQVALRAVASGHFETIQFPFNLVSNEAADELVPLTKEHDVGFIAMKPFAGGRIRSANLAIKYLLQFDNVLPDPGIEGASEIEEIVGIVDGGDWALTPNEQREIEQIHAQVGPRFCRQCEYCMPCPQGVHIPGIMYLPVLWDVWPPDWFFSWGYVRHAVESAQECIECGECEPKCPYQLPIREMIAENLAFFARVAAEHHRPAL